MWTHDRGVRNLATVPHFRPFFADASLISLLAGKVSNSARSGYVAARGRLLVSDLLLLLCSDVGDGRHFIQTCMADVCLG